MILALVYFAKLGISNGTWSVFYETCQPKPQIDGQLLGPGKQLLLRLPICRLGSNEAVLDSLYANEIADALTWSWWVNALKIEFTFSEGLWRQDWLRWQLWWNELWLGLCKYIDLAEWWLKWHCNRHGWLIICYITSKNIESSSNCNRKSFWGDQVLHMGVRATKLLDWHLWDRTYNSWRPVQNRHVWFCRRKVDDLPQYASIFVKSKEQRSNFSHWAGKWRLTSLLQNALLQRRSDKLRFRTFHGRNSPFLSRKCLHWVFQCPNSFKCLAQEFVCNGYADCPGGEDESNCKATCDAPRYLTAVKTPTELKSRNFPYPYLGASKGSRKVLHIIFRSRRVCVYN